MKRFPQPLRVRFVIVQATGVAALLLAAGCGRQPAASAGKTSDLPVAKVRVRKVEATQQPVTEDVVATVRAKTHATLEAKISGRIDTMAATLGQKVKTGDVLVHLDATEFAARVEQAQASLKQAELDWKRVATLFEQQAATRAEYDAADARLRIARGAAEEVLAMMAYTKVIAPFDGVITARWSDAGDLAAPGKPLISIEDPSALRLEADVPESIASYVHQDARLKCRVDGLNGELSGTVREIAPVADPVSRTFRVKLDLPPTPGLMSGRFARLIVPVGDSHSIRVSETALVQRGQMEIVFVVANQHAEMRLVKAGQRSEGMVEILSGLESGESVVIDGAAQLTDGQLVEVQ